MTEMEQRCGKRKALGDTDDSRGRKKVHAKEAEREGVWAPLSWVDMPPEIFSMVDGLLDIVSSARLYATCSAFWVMRRDHAQSTNQLAEAIMNTMGMKLGYAVNYRSEALMEAFSLCVVSVANSLNYGVIEGMEFWPTESAYEIKYASRRSAPPYLLLPLVPFLRGVFGPWSIQPLSPDSVVEIVLRSDHLDAFWHESPQLMLLQSAVRQALRIAAHAFGWTIHHKTLAALQSKQLQ